MLAYLKLLLKERLLAFRPSRNQKAGQSKAKSAASLVGFALIFVMLYGMVVVLEYFLFRGFVMIGGPEGILATVFLLCILITLFVSFFYVFHTLFFSKDILLVSALPISSRGLFGVKLTMVLLGEAGISLCICLPAMILYGVHTGAGLLFYVKAVLFVPFLPVVPIALVALLSFVLIRISALWKRREGVTSIATFALVLGILAGQMSLSGFLETNLSQGMLPDMLLRQFGVVEMIAGWFPPIAWICNVFLLPGGTGWLYGLLLALTSVGVVALLVYGLGGGYQALAVKQGEAVARLNAQGKKGKGRRGTRSPFKAIYLRELKEVFIVPPYASNCLSTLVMFPVMLVVMFLGIGNGGDGMKELAALVPLLQDVAKPLYLAVALGVLSLSCSMNIAVSTAVSREGKYHYFSRIIPVAGRTMLLAKLCMGLTLGGLAMLLMAIVLWVFLPMFWMETLIAFFIAGLYMFMTCAMGLIVDAYRPNFSWKSETEAVKRSVNGVLAMLGAILILGLLVGLFFLLQAIGLAPAWNIAALAAFMAALDGLLLWWLTGAVSTTYSLQEKFD